MIRLLVWLFAGLLLGVTIHIVTILALPILADETVWDRIARIETGEGVLVLPPPAPGEPNPLGLDPALAYGLCLVDLTQGPATMRGTMPEGHWSLAVYDSAGTVIYSTTNRDGIGRTLDLGIFNAAQTRQLAQQELDIAEGVLVVEARDNALFVVVRLAPPHPVLRPRFEAALEALSCAVME